MLLLLSVLLVCNFRWQYISNRISWRQQLNSEFIVTHILSGSFFCLFCLALLNYICVGNWYLTRRPMFSHSVVTLLVELAWQHPLLPFPLLSFDSPFLTPAITLAVHNRKGMKAVFTHEDYSLLGWHRVVWQIRTNIPKEPEWGLFCNVGTCVPNYMQWSWIWGSHSSG